MGGSEEKGWSSMKFGKAILAAGLVVFSCLGPALAGGTYGTEEAHFRRFHIWAGASALASDFSHPALYRDLKNWGFGEDSFEPMEGITWYPHVSGKTRIDLQVDYSATRSVALGLAVSLNSTSCRGYNYEAGRLDASVRGTALFLTVSYAPAPSMQNRRFTQRAGLGAGINIGQAAFETSTETRTFNKNTFSGLVFAGLDYWFLSSLAVGLSIQYRYIPFKTAAFEITGRGIPAATYGLGGIAVGIEAGFRF
jgi:opacity protein-like surface antigen